MKKHFLFTAMFCTIGMISCNLLPGNKNKVDTATTGKGDVVVLYDDGTWAYKDKALTAKEKNDIKKTDSTLSADNTSNSFTVKSDIVNVAVTLNPEKWTFAKSEDGSASEYSFTLKKKDAYAMLISERIEMPMETLKQAALSNARSAAPDIKVMDEQMKDLNGVKVLFMQMDGTIQGIKFSYLGYYYSSAKGTVQLLTYTSQNLLNENRGDMEELLNGMKILQ